MKKFVNGKSLLLLTILLFPSLLYVVLSTGTHNFIRLPIYGPKSEMGQGDTTFYQISDIQFFTCNGESKAVEEFRGNIVLYHFVVNSNPVEEKRKASQLIAINDRFKEKKDIKVRSIIIGDTAELCAFKEEYNLTSSSWEAMGFNGDFNWIKEKYLVDVPAEIQQNQWSNLFVLVDKKGRIRKYRDAIQYVEEKALIDDIKVLKAEEFIPTKRKKDETK